MHTHRALLQSDGCSPHQCHSTQVYEAAVSENIGVFRNLIEGGGVDSININCSILYKSG